MSTALSLGQPSGDSTEAPEGAPAPDSGAMTLLAVVSAPPPPRSGAVVFELDLALVNATNVRDSHGWATWHGRPVLQHSFGDQRRAYRRRRRRPCA